MKQTLFLCCLWLLAFQLCSAQKTLSRTYEAANIASLLLDANSVHSLDITTARTDIISVAVALEGETSEEIVIKEVLKENSLALSFSAWPFATQYNDKLSAHKVVSVLVQLEIPENLFVSITSATAKVNAEGNFDMLYVALEDQPCILKRFTGNANLQTNRGSINVELANSSTSVKAKTTYGNILNDLPNNGNFMISIESIHGDVTLLKTQ